MGCARWMSVAFLAAALAGCDKVPVVDINARFALSDAAWFEAEQTLFFFYRVEAEQGLTPETQVELTWRTDDYEQPWTPVSELPTVHTHLPVDCGHTGLCGSTSLKVEQLPRQVRMRVRYHRDGEVFLDSQTRLNVIAAGPAHTQRSLLIYGVFDEHNQHVQWRARHQFPTLRNHEVQDLGLRRHFTVSDPRFGELGPAVEGNPYGYGMDPVCPDAWQSLGWPQVETTDRAVFDSNPLPLAASTAGVVCARSTVTDARGTFTTAALARKNPEVRPAFPGLRSPIRENTPVPFVLRPCNRTISDAHLSMQVQRLLAAGAPEVCTDDWANPLFPGQLASRLKAAIDEARLGGQDLVLLLALHHDDTTKGFGAMVEQALMQVLPFERDKSSPRVSGAFVFDSNGYTMVTADLKPLVLWCPANLNLDDLDQLPLTSEMSCPLQPDFPDLKLGPFKFGNLPILPTRKQYLNFIEKYSDAQAGKMKSLRFLAPERTPLSENYPLGEFGVVTFFNGEVLTAEPTDAFSYCKPEDGSLNPVVFRTPFMPEPLPLESLPDVHEAFPMPSYALGLWWEFPYLLRLHYEVVLAGAASAYSLSVPFGIHDTTEAYWGAAKWETGEFPLAERLLQCRRFCDHPTFDSGGVYNVTALFKPAYKQQCYRPVFPKVGDGGFPFDP